MKYSSTALSNANTGSVPGGKSNVFVARCSFCFNTNGEKSSKISISSVPSALASILVHTCGEATISPVVTPSNQLSNSCTATANRSTHDSRTSSSNGSVAKDAFSIPAVSAMCSTMAGEYPNARHSASRSVPGARASFPLPSSSDVSPATAPRSNALTTSFRSYLLNPLNRSSGY